MKQREYSLIKDGELTVILFFNLKKKSTQNMCHPEIFCPPPPLENAKGGGQIVPRPVQKRPPWPPWPPDHTTPGFFYALPLPPPVTVF